MVEVSDFGVFKSLLTQLWRKEASPYQLTIQVDLIYKYMGKYENAL